MSLITAKLTEEQIRQLKAPAQRERLFRTISYFSPILLLLLWEIASQLNVIDRRFFPPPSAIAGTAWQMIASFEIFDHIGATLRRVSVGYVMGAVPGILLGLILGLSQPARRVLGPIFAALYPVPKIAILPLILLIFGVGDASKFVVIAIGVFFLLLYNTMGGVMQTPQIYLDVAKNAGATRFQTFFRIALPSALPNIFTGLRLAAGLHHHRGGGIPWRAQRRRLLHLGVVADLCGVAHVRRHRGDLGPGLSHHSRARGAGTAFRALGKTLRG